MAGDDLDALYLLAREHVAGDRVPRDLGRARALLARAAAMGHADSALLHAAFLANGIGGEPDWRGALRQLRTAAESDADAAAELALIEAMRIDADGAPAVRPASRAISIAPDVHHLPGLFTAAECLYVAQSASPRLAPSTVFHPSSGQRISHPVRTSFTAPFGPFHETVVIHALNRRIAAATGTPVANGEPLIALRYASGQEYRPHHDAIARTDNQRVWTVLVYLNDGYEGGATRFFGNNMDVRGRQGDGVMFRNVDAAGLPDPAARHAGLPVTKGTKWLATRWIRAQPHDPFVDR